MGIALVPIGFALYTLIVEVGWRPFVSLPSDDEMIRNFYEHRQDFELLVHTYREDLVVPADFGIWEPTPELNAIAARINVSRVVGNSAIWMPPDPHARIDPRIRRLRSDLYSPALRKFSCVLFSYGRSVVRLECLAPVTKKYYYIPFVPIIRRGNLILRGNTVDDQGRILQTLDRYPPDFGSRDCVYRRIEPHWYIKMCQGRCEWEEE